LRCARCGNENSDANRFCGMCGAKLLTEAVSVASATAEITANRSTTAASAVPAPLPSPVAPQTVTPQIGAPQTAGPRTSAPLAEAAPVISGPSFLGLNQPEPAPRRRGSLSIDPNSAPSSANLDYLLQDDEEEEERRSGGVGKFVFILLALALAVGLGYLRWKNQGFGWLGSGASKPAAAVQTSDATPPSSTMPPSTTSGPAASPADAPSASPPASAPAATAAPTQPATGSAVPAGSPVADSPTPNPATSTAPANPAASAPGPSDAENPPADVTATPSVPAAKPPAPTTPTPTATGAKPNQAAAAPPAKPSAALKPVNAVDPVSEAQKYIYGRGVPQNCDRGLRLLKPAADQANSKAMIEMGALYSAGLCTPHDLPTAYRWFARALRKDPDNQAVQTDLSKLWAEMTPAERQLAIKLSQ